MERLRHLHPADLGRRPADLARTLARLAVAGPGVSAMRALALAVDQPDGTRESAELQVPAFTVAEALRSRLGRPESQGAVRLAHPDSGLAYWRAALRYAVDGGLQAVLDEWVHVMRGGGGVSVPELAESMASALALRTSVARANLYDGEDDLRLRTHLAMRFGRQISADEKNLDREDVVRRAFNSPFWPFVLATTSVGQEGLDFHSYCHAVVHWNLPGNPVDLEQREGRVHRYQGHAVRKNVAAAYGAQVLREGPMDAWAGMFHQAASARPPEMSEINPAWVFPGGSAIQRIVPQHPLSRESARYRRLVRTVATYRLAFGQPRQEDLLRLVGEGAQGSGQPDLDWARVNLEPGPKLVSGVQDPAPGDVIR